MFFQVLSSDRRRFLEQLSVLGVEGFYLAGGTALALQLGHRLSEDFDFFINGDFKHYDIIDRLKVFPDLKILEERRGTLYCIVNNIKLSFISYKYPLLYNTVSYKVKLADIRDIALMKITAISGRGSKKDFVDLYFICKEGYSPEFLFSLLEQKFQGVNYNRYHLIKSLAYFEDADKEPELEMLQPVNWHEVKEFFIDAQQKLARLL